jgi:hypothetical protein
VVRGWAMSASGLLGLKLVAQLKQAKAKLSVVLPQNSAAVLVFFAQFSRGYCGQE